MAKSKRTKWINFSRNQDPKLMDMIDEFSSFQRLKPTTAIKQYLLQTLPGRIRDLRAGISSMQINCKHTNKQSQEKNWVKR